MGAITHRANSVLHSAIPLIVSINSQLTNSSVTLKVLPEVTKEPLDDWRGKQPRGGSGVTYRWASDSSLGLSPNRDVNRNVTITSISFGLSVHSMKDFSPRVFRKGIDRSRPSSDEKPRSTTTDNSFRCCSCSLQGIHAVVRRTLREESCSVQNARAVASCGLQDAVLVERDVPCPTGMVCVRSGLNEFYRTSPCQ